MAQQQQTTPRRGSNRLTRPWNQLSDLSDDVKTKIIAIHRKSVEDVAAIHAKEHEDIVALLSEAQKKQLDALQKEVDAKLGKILNSEQKKQLEEMRPGPGGPGRRGLGGPGGRGCGGRSFLMAAA